MKLSDKLAYPFLTKFEQIQESYRVVPLEELVIEMGNIASRIDQVLVYNWSDFLSLHPQDKDNQSFMNPGWERHMLYVVDNKGNLHPIDMDMGHKVIYPARNLIASGYADDIPENDIDVHGEEVRDALCRVKEPYEYAALLRLEHVGNVNLSSVIIAEKPTDKNISRWIYAEDAAFMASFYDNHLEQLGTITGRELVSNIEWRIYTEWCCSHSSRFRAHSRYQGEGFSDWINNETHIALVTEGHQWNDSEQKFSYDGDFGEIYQAVRTEILKAAVRRAVDFFKDCEDYKWVPKENSENLRTSLEGYILHI